MIQWHLSPMCRQTSIRAARHEVPTREDKVREGFAILNYSMFGHRGEEIALRGLFLSDQLYTFRCSLFIQAWTFALKGKLQNIQEGERICSYRAWLTLYALK